MNGAFPSDITPQEKGAGLVQQSAKLAYGQGEITIVVKPISDGRRFIKTGNAYSLQRLVNTSKPGELQSWEAVGTATFDLEDVRAAA